MMMLLTEPRRVPTPPRGKAPARRHPAGALLRDYRRAVATGSIAAVASCERHIYVQLRDRWGCAFTLRHAHWVRRVFDRVQAAALQADLWGGAA